ncbi:MAG: hypothetical protein ACHQQR_08795 [Gemmatimonadales bacterium]
MTQILRVEFSLKADEVTVVAFPAPDIAGNVVRCIVRCAEPQPPPHRVAPFVSVVHIECSNVRVLLPEGGLRVDELELIPLRLPVNVACWPYLRLCCPYAASGYALAVVEREDPPPPPPVYAFGLIPRP